MTLHELPPPVTDVPANLRMIADQIEDGTLPGVHSSCLVLAYCEEDGTFGHFVNRSGQCRDRGYNLALLLTAVETIREGCLLEGAVEQDAEPTPPPTPLRSA